MKRLHFKILGLLILTTVILTNCSKEKEPDITPVQFINIDTLSFSHSMKGWELYSWSNGNDWNYSILAGTNRLKTYQEVTKNAVVVSGKDSLKLLLNKFPAEENIIWIGQGWLERIWGDDYQNLSLPDSRTIMEIKNYCSLRNLSLNVAN